MNNRALWRDGPALAFTLLSPLVVAWVYFVLLAGQGQQTNPAFIAAYIGGKLVEFLFPFVYVLCTDRDQLRPSLPTTSGLWLGAAFAALVAAGLFVLYFGLLAGTSLVSGAPDRIHEKLRGFGLDSPGGFVLIALFLSVVHSLMEEYYWRWFTFGWLKRYLPVAAAVVVSGVGFMLHHIVILGVFFPGRFWAVALPLSFCVGIGGMVWAWIYHRSGSLYAAWLSHALIDMAIMVVGYDMLRAGWAG